MTKFYVRKVRLNSQGYTSQGYYFGTGQPLYQFEGEKGYPFGELRASSRAEAYCAGRIAQAEEDAEIARAHKGSARQDRAKRGRIDPEAADEILAEERGENIAAGLIAAAIRANIAELKVEGTK